MNRIYLKKKKTNHVLIKRKKWILNFMGNREISSTLFGAKQTSCDILI
jgi:hypothetical protein